MQFSKFNVTPVKVIKGFLIVVAGILVLAFAFSLIRMASSSLGFDRGFRGNGLPQIGIGAPAFEADMSHSYYREGAVSDGGAMKSLSIRNVLPILPPRPGTTGSNAESFEVTDWSATIETRRLEKTCASISKLKALTYVIFESANQSDNNCNYTFKVEHAKVSEVLATIEELDPKDLSENTYTIKREVEDFTNAIDILEKKRSSIDKTLESALRAYDEITALATRTQNADALAKIIDSKIGIIERLTVERINVSAELERLARSKEEQLDRLKYTYFQVSVYENVFVDGERLADSWKAAIKDFVQAFNSMLQFITVGLLGFLVWLIPFALYLLILLIIGKYGWRAIKYVWYR